jgi:hypothetical protein
MLLYCREEDEREQSVYCRTEYVPLVLLPKESISHFSDSFFFLFTLLQTGSAALFGLQTVKVHIKLREHLHIKPETNVFLAGFLHGES